MRGIDYVALALGAGGLAFGALSYSHLRRWVRHARSARIAIAYKRKVVLDAPLTEWIEWSHMLDKDQDRGRVVYRGGHVSVAIARPRKRKDPPLPSTRTEAQVVKQT